MFSKIFHWETRESGAQKHSKAFLFVYSLHLFLFCGVEVSQNYFVLESCECPRFFLLWDSRPGVLVSQDLRPQHFQREMSFGPSCFVFEETQRPMQALLVRELVQPDVHRAGCAEHNGANPHLQVDEISLGTQEDERNYQCSRKLRVWQINLLCHADRDIGKHESAVAMVSHSFLTRSLIGPRVFGESRVVHHRKSYFAL